METTESKNQLGFTLIELLAVMAIVAVLAGIVAISVGGTGETSRDAQTKQDGTTVESAASDFFADQKGAEVLTPKTVSVFDVDDIRQVTSSRWPEDYISETYSNVFSTSIAGSNVNSLLLLTGEDSTRPITPGRLLKNFNAVNFDALTARGYLPDEPDGARSLTSDLYDNYLWLLQRTTAAGGSSDGASRQVSVFKLVSVRESEVNFKADLTYVQIVGTVPGGSNGSENTPPLALGGGVDTDVNTPVTIFLVGSDADEDSLTFTVTRQPIHGSLDETFLGETPPSLVYTPDLDFVGPDSLEFSVSDGDLANTATVFIFVKPPTLLVVVPDSNEFVEGDSVLSLPFNLSIDGKSSMRYQQVYAASAFGTLFVPHLITQISFRPDAGAGGVFSSTIDNVQINLSTTSREPDNLSPNFMSSEFLLNVGPDETEVFSGSLALSSSFAGPSGGPKDFDIVIQLQQPFLYNPAHGNLLLDVRNFTGGTTTRFDRDLSASMRLVSSFTPDGVADSTGAFASGGLVTEFTMFPVLSPS